MNEATYVLVASLIAMRTSLLLTDCVCTYSRDQATIQQRRKRRIVVVNEATYVLVASLIAMRTAFS